MNKAAQGYELYKFLKTKSGFILGVLMWFAGFYFSKLGFTRYLDLPENHPLGYLLGATITWLQISLNEGTNNHPTLYVSGILSYVYGIFTNWMGLLSFQLVFFSNGLIYALENSLTETIIRVILTFVLGVLFEVLPEHMITYGLFGESYAGDVLRSLSKGITWFRKNGQKPAVSFKQPVRSERTERSSFMNKRSPSSLNNVEQRVQAYVERYRSQNSGKIPSYNLIVQNTPLTSKAQVKPILDKLGSIER